MGKWRQRFSAAGLAGCAWVGLCFGLTSAVYLSWLDRLVALAGPGTADWLSMVAGYALQAAGAGLAVLWLRDMPEGRFGRRFFAALLVFTAMIAPTLLAPTPTATVFFGMTMNLLCGVIAGFYLVLTVRRVPAERRGLAFGGGYALATVAVGLLALIGRGRLLHSPRALAIYLPLGLGLALAARRQALPEDDGAAPAQPDEALSGRDLALACAVVALLSLVKNLGFSFPSGDIAAGLVPELSRLPYALGLIAAGWIADRDRRSGMLCVVAALALPFIMLGLAGEPVSSAVCWGLDYLFYGFFSVFRVVLFMDIADRTRRPALAALGLALGRAGDAAGTAIGLLLGGQKLALIAATALLFFFAIWLFFRLYRKLYEPEAVRQRSEQEVFEAFCLHNDISAREREVLRLVISGHSNGEIAEALFIAESTVKYHVRNILQKTGCKNRTELQRKYTAALYPHLETAPKLTLLTKEATGS